MPTGPIVVYSIYRRDWRLLVATLCWASVSQFFFTTPASRDSWTTRAALAQRWWARSEDNGMFGLTYPNGCNTAGGIALLYTLYAAWQRRPLGTTVGTAVAFGLNLWWVGCLIRRYDAQMDPSPTRQAVVDVA